MNKEKLKKEFAGLLLAVIGFFYIGSLLFFSPGDAELLSSLKWYEVFGRHATDVAGGLNNPFGILGARLADLLIRDFLGYISMIPGLAFFYWGWSVARLTSIKPPLFFTIYIVFMTLGFATMFGLSTLPNADLMAGVVGRMLAALLSTLIGYTGAWILMLALALGATVVAGRIFSEQLSLLGRALAAFGDTLAVQFRKMSEARREKKQQKAEQKSRSSKRAADHPSAEQPSKNASPASPVMPLDGGMTPGEFPPVPEAPESAYVETGDDGSALDALPGTDEEDSEDEPEITIRESVHEKEADLDKRRLKVRTRDRVPYRFPSVDLLQRTREEDEYVDESLLEESKNRLLEKLRIYKVEVLRISATVGPRVTLFELELAPDVKVSKITSLENDLAMAMAARGIRIIAPIPGKNAVGVEIPHGRPRTVWMRSVLQVEKFKSTRLTLPVVLGRTISNEVYIDDLATMPHLLIAGATGAGKSVGINVMLSSLLYSCSPDKIKFVLIDPKRVELFHYHNLKNHFLVTFDGLDEQIITEPAKAVYALRSVVKEMELRYEKLEQAGVRNIADFNRKLPGESLPYLVVVIDELADLMMTGGKDVEEPITRLAQLARAVGIHLIVATQRPSVDIITGVIKANFPARIAFQVASKVDSRTILDGSGADQLLGNGDMLYQPATQPKPERIQCPYISSGEVEAITSFIGRQDGLKEPYRLPKPDIKDKNSSFSPGAGSGRESRDPMFVEAAHLVVMHQQGSVSLLQRRLKLGFSRAARVMDQLEANGIVGPAEGSKPREVLIDNRDALELLLNNLDDE
ncbi:DNA translocase FtsK [Prosthecochloris sp. ZM_2]|uniref:DNA translocase FtsK n=1 Tax=Prosthecochloris sp. ZM_2 TaxID=2045206 RepID=UPI000DF78F11|nr:DNA translocase FtsK [Prosthecochloris sp. ZM_2]RNA65364.1 DNA translocase FtsK [Prosthecochloris sp. ZM_2]